MHDTEKTQAPRLSAEFGERPRDDELDLFGITHMGKVRLENQDHFLVATVHPRAGDSRNEPSGPAVAADPRHSPGDGDARGGRRRREHGRSRGEPARDRDDHAVRVVDAALLSRGGIVARRRSSWTRSATRRSRRTPRCAPSRRCGRNASRMATTLTLFIAVWPWAYVVQVGDSRCYYHHDGKLRAS